MPSLRDCLLELREEESQRPLRVHSYDYGCEIELPDGSQAGFRWDTINARLIAELAQTLINYGIRKLQVIGGDRVEAREDPDVPMEGELPTGVFDAADWINEYVIRWYEETSYPGPGPTELVKLERVRKLLSNYWHDGISRSDGENY